MTDETWHVPCERPNRLHRCGFCAGCRTHARRYARRYPIEDRIMAALRATDTRIRYEDLAAAVFPWDHMPRAWRYSSNGGPPGCYMALSRALSRLGIYASYDGRVRYFRGRHD